MFDLDRNKRKCKQYDTKTKHFRHKLACTKVACIWFKLINNVMFSEMGKVPKSTKLLLPKLLLFFFGLNLVNICLVLFIGYYVNRLLG